MTADRAEWTGVGAALIFHIALIAALSTSLASTDDVPEPPSMEVELVDEVALAAAAPTPLTRPPASQPPPMPSEIAPPAPPQPSVVPLPPQRVSPQPTARPTPQPTARPAPQPPRPVQRSPAQTSRRAGIGDDFLKTFDDDLAPRAGPSRPAAPTFSAKARTNVATAIASQAQRCADRQPYLGEGADQLKVQVRLSFARSGRLSRPPSIAAISGDSDLRAKYGDLLDDQVRRIFADCAPFRLPADLYETDNGGWKETTLSYRVRK